MSTASLAAHELGAAAARAHRSRRAWQTTGAGLAAKAVNYGARLVTIPLALRLLGAAPYGLWLTAGSLIAWLNFADLGLGSGLVNAVASANGAQRERAARQLISTAFAAMLPIAAAIALGVSVLSHSPVALRWMGAAADRALAAEAARLLRMLGFLFAASFVLSPVNNICAALQEGYRSHLASIASTLATLGLLVILSQTGTSLSGFALAMGLPAVIATLLLALHLFGGEHSALRPQLADVDLRCLHSISAQGGPLFIAMLSDLSVVYSINILVAATFGAAAVPRIAVPTALLAVFVNTCGSILQPYWPAYADAAARGDWSWIRTAARRTIRLTAVLAGAGALGTAVLGRPFISLWAGEGAVPSQALLNALAFYAVTQVMSYATGILLMGLGLLNTRAILHGAAAFVHWIGFWVLSPHFGIAALPVAGTFGYGAEALAAAFAARRALRSRAA